MKRLLLALILTLLLALPAMAAPDYAVTLNASTTSTTAYIQMDSGLFSYSTEYDSGVTGSVALQYKLPADSTWKTLTRGTFTGSDYRYESNIGGPRQWRFIVTSTLSGNVKCVIRQTQDDKFARPK